MQLIKELVNRLAGVPLPENLWFRLSTDEYRITGITKKGVEYSYGSSNQHSSTLSPYSNTDLIFTGLTREIPRTLRGKPKYVFECKFI